MTGHGKVDRASRLAALLNTDNAALRDSERVRANAQRMRAHGNHARETARRMRETARRVRDRLRDVILTLRPSRFRPLTGASDERHDGRRASIWMSPAVADGAMCSECGRAIVIGETMYDVFVDGREIRLDSRCGSNHIEQQVHVMVGAERRPKPV